MQRKILVVDDSIINRQILRRMLRGEYEILEASNGKQALGILARASDAISAILLDIVMPIMDGYDVLEKMRADQTLSQIPVIVTTGNSDDESEIKALKLGANDFISKPYNPEIILHRLKNTIRLRETAAVVNAMQRDKLTGLYNRETFFTKCSELIAERDAGYYTLSCLDIDSFKVINDRYGSARGDKVLKYIADVLRNAIEPSGGLCCRIAADNFAVLYSRYDVNQEKLDGIMRDASTLDGTIPPITISVGRYLVDDKKLSISAMYDRASIAVETIKGRFDTHIARFDEEMLATLVRHQEITNEMKRALEEKQFEVWFQPQYNHSTIAPIGAEALVRWRHPEKGIIPPAEFIPVFERNGFIYEMDKYVWESTCALLRKWLDEGRSPLPVSVNISRYDVLREDLIGTITGLILKYKLPAELLRLEITETAFAKSSGQMVRVVKQLIDYGFTIEIDDFGSGYSSLNTLKDVPAQIVKLDMRFLENNDETNRGGNILESVVRMAKWLGMTVIAEGVETVEQANYLNSIGCQYIQGYLYARPMPVDKYEALVAGADGEEKRLDVDKVETVENNAFWDPKSMDTLIFNSYVGGACIFEYINDNIEILRVNDKYAREIIGYSVPANIAISTSVENFLDSENKAALTANIARAVATGEEATCELNMRLSPRHKAGARHLQVTVRVIARSGERALLYATVFNTTALRLAEERQRITANQMQAIIDNVSGGVSAATINGDKIIYIFVNDMYYAMLGFTKEQFESELVNGIRDIILPEDVDGVVAAIAEVNKTEESFSLEYRVRRRDGDVIWIRSNGSVCRITGYTQPLLLVISYDITSEKQSEQKIRYLNETLVKIMNDTPGGFARMRVYPDASGYVDYVNSGYCQLFGMRDTDAALIPGADIMDGVHPDDMALVRARILAALAGNERINARYRLLHKNGEYVWVQMFGRIINNDEGEAYLNAYYTELSAKEAGEIPLRKMLFAALAPMMESSSDLMFVKDENFNYVCCSRAFALMVGLENERQITGKTDYDLFSIILAERYRSDDITLIQSGEPLIDYIEPIPGKGEITRSARTSKYLLRDSHGAIIGIYGIGRETTECQG